MPKLILFHSFSEAVHEGVHNFASHSLRVMLTNTAPSLSWTRRSDVTGELSTGGGYTSTGAAITTVSSSQSSGLYTLILQDVTFTGSGSGFGPWRYAIVYNDSATNDELIGYIDYGYPISVVAGATVTIDFDGTSGAYYSSLA